MDVTHCNIGLPMGKFWMLPIITLSGNWSSLKIDLITEDPKIRKLYCIERSTTNNRNMGNKSLYNCTKKKKLFNPSKHENILS